MFILLITFVVCCHNGDIKNILIGIMCSGFVSSSVELPNLVNYKINVKNNLYRGLFDTKLFLLQFNDNIDDRLKENHFEYKQYPLYYLNNISNNINLFNQSDDTIFTNFGSKKKIFFNSKRNFYNLYNSIYIESINLENFRNNLELKYCTIDDLHEQLKKIKIVNNKLIKELDFIAVKNLSKKNKKRYISNSKQVNKLLKESKQFIS